MATPAQIAANRANAKKSTGPKTEEGRRAAAANNYRHGLISISAVQQWEDKEEFKELWDNLHAEHKPETPTQTQLVEWMVQHAWLAQRALLLQNDCFSSEGDVFDPKALALYMRYQTTHQRSFLKHLNELQKLRKQTLQEEIGFERKNAVAAAEKRALELHEHRLRIAKAKADWHEARFKPKTQPAKPIATEEKPATGPLTAANNPEFAANPLLN